MSDENLQISYSVKEVLERIEGKVDGLLNALVLKADAAIVQALSEKLGQAEDRLAAVEHQLRANEQHSRWRTEWRRWLIPTLLTVVVTAVSIASMFHH